jgi:hypothetical protein
LEEPASRTVAVGYGNWGLVGNGKVLLLATQQDVAETWYDLTHTKNGNKGGGLGGVEIMARSMLQWAPVCYIGLRSCWHTQGQIRTQQHEKKEHFTGHRKGGKTQEKKKYEKASGMGGREL